jgi:hypothetical protein
MTTGSAQAKFDP